MRFKKPMASLAILSVAALAACGGSSDSPGSTSSSAGDVKSSLEQNTSSGTDPTAVGPLTIDGATPGGTVTVSNQSGSMATEWDPRGVYYSDTIAVQSSLLVRSLTQWKWDDTAKAMVLVPDMATDLGQSNDTFTEWTFTLKDGLKYQDGTPVVSQDIAYSVAGSLDCNTFTDCPSNYLLSTLEGMDKYKPGKIPTGIQTPDDKTIVFTFTEPFADLSYYAFFPLFGAIPADQPSSEPGKYTDNVLATGPYMIKKRVPQKSLDLVRNPNWDPATDPGRAALPDEWVFDTTSTDIKQQDAILLSDRGATYLSYDEVDASDVQTFQSQAPDQLSQGPQPLTRWLAPTIQNAPKGVKNVPIEARKALTWAYPYQEAAKAAGLLWEVNAIPTTTLIAPGTPGRTEQNAIPDHEAGVTDTDMAKKILTDAGLVGFQLSFLYSTDDPTSVAAMKVVKASYEKSGFTVKPIATTTTDFSSKRSDPSTPINLRPGGWFSDWPSGYSWIPPIFAPNDPSKPCADQDWTNIPVVNYGQFCEDDVNQKIAETKALPVEEQPAAWNDLEKYIMETYYPVIPNINGATVQAHGSKVQGVNIDNTGGMPTFKTVWLSQ